MALLDFARGPGLAFAAAVFALGLAWRIAGIFRRPARAEHSAPRLHRHLSVVYAKERFHSRLVSEFVTFAKARLAALQAVNAVRPAA